MESLTANISGLAIETTGLVVIENVLNYFASENRLVHGIAGFVIKNTFSLLMHSFTRTSDPTIPAVYKDDFYYISIGMNF